MCDRRGKIESIEFQAQFVGGFEEGSGEGSCGGKNGHKWNLKGLSRRMQGCFRRAKCLSFSLLLQTPLRKDEFDPRGIRIGPYRQNPTRFPMVELRSEKGANSVENPQAL